MAEALARPLPDDIEALAEHVAKEACERQLSLVTAESCTGGLLASLLTDIPGLSHAFERGFVTYSDEAKHELLGVPDQVLRDFGAVSREAALAMAEGALSRSKGDIAVSITGYADDDPTDPRSVAGLVHFACARNGLRTSHIEKRFGDVGRAEVRHRCLETALRLIADAL